MNNLHLYHKLLDALRQLLPNERVTRQRNGVLLVLGLYLGHVIHLPCF